MCTVSLIARKNGYALAMNRDEKLARVAGLPPKLRLVAGRKILCPSEPGGGTWIALNDAGITFALINWYAITARVKANSISRGEVVNAVSATISAAAAAVILEALPLHRKHFAGRSGKNPLGVWIGCDDCIAVIHPRPDRFQPVCTEPMRRR